MVCVVSNTGKRLMPTTEYKARKLMEKGRAKIYQYDPFTIIILDREDGYTQSIELKCDTGDKHIGMSICSEKHEYVSVEVNPLKDEKEKHNDQKILFFMMVKNIKSMEQIIKVNQFNYI